eukprot:TRINITY_DN16890_c0_g1_i1.p1 TRINITY_DN16890_c0_g1~~TRINITY_DN16890_c0_g1_i1.p1  ORF type:complete len:229 (+),score=47.23 TRINITY_DN16890_c0_g1_i1:67-753(+)
MNGVRRLSGVLFRHQTRVPVMSNNAAMRGGAGMFPRFASSISTSSTTSSRSMSLSLLGYRSGEMTTSSTAMPSRLQKRSFMSGSEIPAEALSLGVLNHVAIVVPDIEKSTAFYRDILGATDVSGQQQLPEHGVTTVFVNLGNTKIELLEPLGADSPVANFLKSKPDGGIHHICMEVSDVYKAVKVLNEKGIRVLNPVPKIGAHGLPVVFLHPKSCNGVLVELEQSAPK